MIPTVEKVTRAIQEVMPRPSITDPALMPELTFTPSPAPLVTATTSALSEIRVFSTTLHVATARTLLTVGEILTVEVSIHDSNVGCRFGAMDLTLSQQNGDVFAIEPHKVTSPGSGAVFTLTAVSSGTVTLYAYAFGEHNCGHSRSDWYWAGVGGTSGPITIVESAAVLVPTVTPGPSSILVVPTATTTHGPAHMLTGTPMATATPTLAPTIPLQIVSFTASPSPADPAGGVTLTWNVRGASSVIIQWVDKRSEGVIHAGLPLAGSMSVDLSGVKFSEGDTVRFSLALHDAAGALMFGADGRAFEERISVSLQTAMRIAFFSASPDPIERGGTVTLAWDAPGAAGLGITRLSEEGNIFVATEALDLPASGSVTLRVPEEYVESVKYYLGARDANGVLHKAYVTVGIICPYDEYLAPRCPLTRDSVWAAYEPFERGHMIWRSDTREIHVLYDDGSYETYEDSWQEGDPVDIPGTPPPGRYAPVRGFGNLYANRPHLQERLGWASAPEVGYTMIVEIIPGGSGHYPGTSTYFTLPDSRVVNLYPFSSTWRLLP